MFSRRLKTGYFILEGLNSFAVVYFFYYLYFYMQKVYGFGNKANLALAAMNGGTYALTAWFGGRFAQRFGYFPALKLGFAVMALALGLGWALDSVAGEILVMVLVVVGMSFTWPTLEALVSENEPAAGLQHMIGVYNVVWATTAAVGNFIGGAILDHLGLRSLFYVPLAVLSVQLGLTFWLERRAGPPHLFRSPPGTEAVSLEVPGLAVGEVALSNPMATDLLVAQASQKLTKTQASGGLRKSRNFLSMAWLANPFAYIGINTLIAVVPGVAHRLELSTMMAGFCCSAWCFARLAAFALLWQWNGWHYRFRWLLVAYIMLTGSFVTILLVPNLVVLVLSQVLFGWAVGLLYYSSLFYSMDLSDTKGEHGGLHEAAIGLGNFAGPALGAAALQFLPQYPHSGALAVTLLLLCGLGGLTMIWRNGRSP
jgi:predicted MFS family arabinose efflux permease